MTLTGYNGNPPHPDAEKAMHKLVAEFVEKTYVRTYYQLDPPPTGGVHVCIEPTEPQGYNEIISKLQSISFSSFGFLDIQLVESCKPPPPILIPETIEL